MSGLANNKKLLTLCVWTYATLNAIKCKVVQSTYIFSLSINMLISQQTVVALSLLSRIAVQGIVKTFAEHYHPVIIIILDACG